MMMTTKRWLTAFFFFLFPSLLWGNLSVSEDGPNRHGKAKVCYTNYHYKMAKLTKDATFHYGAKAPISSSPLKLTLPSGEKMLVVASEDGNVHFITLDGIPRATYSVGSLIESSPAALPDGRVVLGADDGLIYFLRLNTDGNSYKIEAKTLKTGGPVLSSPLVIQEGRKTYVVVGSEDSFIYFLDDRAQVLTKVPTGGGVSSSPMWVPGHKTIVAASYDGFVYFLDLEGKEKAKYETEGPISSSPAVIPANGEHPSRIVVGSFDKFVHFVNLDGTPHKKYPTLGVVSSSPAVMSDRTVVIASEDRGLYFLNPDPKPQDQTLRRLVGVGESIFSPPTSMENNTAFVISYKGKVLLMNANGTLRAKMDLEREVLSSATVIDQDTVIISDQVGDLHQLKISYVIETRRVQVPCPEEKSRQER